MGIQIYTHTYVIHTHMHTNILDRTNTEQYQNSVTDMKESIRNFYLVVVSVLLFFTYIVS